LNNHQLQQAVRDELRFDPSFAEADIKVEAVEGAVSLTGTVPTYSQKRFALRAAQRVGGVQTVADDIVVRIPAEVTATDQDIASCASQSLAWDTSVPEQVKATVDHGVLTLSGAARNHFEKSAAELNVSRLYGVTGIVNRIEVRPAGPPAAGFTGDITKALQRFAFEGADMKVTAEGGKVYLNGTVANAHQRAMAEHAAWSPPGVTQVEERLTIN
jgi:osmotically-inducible protein OsmY